MSSTNRGGAERVADDNYATPAWTTRALLPKIARVDGFRGRRILEPSAGRGNIIRELVKAGASPAGIVAVEKDRGRADVLIGEWAGTGMTVICDDFLRVPVGSFDYVVMNPPFSAAEEHIKRAISFLAPGGVCAALLRLAFCTGAKRSGFRERYPFNLYPLASRPSFTAEALAWMTEDDLRAEARKAKTKPGEPERLETPDEVRTRLRGSDSADYAWMTYSNAPAHVRYGGRFEVLEGRDGS